MEKSIVCVHGRAQVWELEDKLQREWRDAIRAGIKRSQEGTTLFLSDNQFTLAFYGDLFRPDATEGSKAPFIHDALFEEELAEVLIQEAIRRDLIDQNRGAKSLAQETEPIAEKGIVAKSKHFLHWLDKVPGLSSFLLSGFVRDVDLYLHNPALRVEVINRVVFQLKQQQQMGREVILVAHSLGTVIAYDALSTNPDITVSSFITLGSPLGTHYIYKSLLPIGQQPFFPSPIKEDWHNFYDSDDIVALVPELAPHFSSSSGKLIKSMQVYNRPNNHHSSSDYLSSKKVGNALRLALQL